MTTKRKFEKEGGETSGSRFPEAYPSFFSMGMGMGTGTGIGMDMDTDMDMDMAQGVMVNSCQ